MKSADLTQAREIAAPTYSELLSALRSLSAYVETYMPSRRINGDPITSADALLKRAEAAPADIDQDVRLNRALWTLAEEMRKLKA